MRSDAFDTTNAYFKFEAQKFLQKNKILKDAHSPFAYLTVFVSRRMKIGTLLFTKRVLLLFRYGLYLLIPIRVNPRSWFFTIIFLTFIFIIIFFKTVTSLGARIQEIYTLLEIEVGFISLIQHRVVDIFSIILGHTTS